MAGLSAHIREDYASCRNPPTDPERPARPLWVEPSTALERVAMLKTRFEKSGTNASKTRIIRVGRVRIARLF